MSTFAERLRQMRRLKGFTQLDLAQALGVSKTTVVGWEADSHGPRKTSVENIAEVLGTDARWLLLGDNAPNPSAAPDQTAALLASGLSNAAVADNGNSRQPSQAATPQFPLLTLSKVVRFKQQRNGDTGASTVELAQDVFPFPLPWLTSRGIDTEAVYFLSNDDDTAPEDYPVGSIIGVAFANLKFSREGDYVVVEGDKPKIRRVSAGKAKNSYVLHGKSKRGITRSAKDIQLISRVFWTARFV